MPSNTAEPSPLKRPHPSEEELALELVLNPATNYPRKRVAIACEICRTRKTRCDAKRPCSFCTEAGVECVYRQSAQNEKYSTATDILSRIEDRLTRLEDLLVNNSKNSPGLMSSKLHTTESENLLTRQKSNDSISVASSGLRNSGLDARSTLHKIASARYFEASFRQTATEATAPRPSLLSFQCPYFIRGESWDETKTFYDYQLAQQTELNLWVDKVITAGKMMPPLDVTVVYGLQNRFLEHVLKWFPLFEMSFFVRMCDQARKANWSITEPATCLSMMAFAIADTFDVNAPMLSPSDSSHTPSLFASTPGWEAGRTSSTSPSTGPSILSDRGRLYYSQAVAALTPLKHQKHSIFGMQCRVLQSLYHNITIRTLAAWDVSSELARDMMNFLSSNLYADLDAPSQESFNRVFWTASLILHELESAHKMHPIGLLGYHELVPLPYSAIEDESLYYFFAQVSMRKILTDAMEIVGYRVSHVIYAPIVTEELKQQVEKWYHALPQSMIFSLDSAPLFDLRKAYLRYQYMAVRIVMFWPAILKILESNATRGHEHLQVGDHLLGPQQESRDCVQSCVQCCYSSTEILSRQHLGLHLSIWLTYASMIILLVVHCLPGLAFIPETRNPDPIRKAYQSLCRWENEPLLRAALERARRLMQKASITP